MRETERRERAFGEEQRELELVLLENSQGGLLSEDRNFGDEINFSTRIIIDTRARALSERE